MSTCPTCFLVRSATGACDCEESLSNTAAVLEQPVAPLEAVIDPRELVADGDLANVQRVTRALMDHYGLKHLDFKWGNSKRRIGTTWSHRLTGPYMIELSRPFYEHMSPEQRMNTITHEIAHALVGCGHGHDHVWQRKHMELGGDGSRCSDAGISEDAATKIFKWTGRCPNGHLDHRSAKSEKMFRTSCGKCSPRYNPDYKFVWTQNY